MVMPTTMATLMAGTVATTVSEWQMAKRGCLTFPPFFGRPPSSNPYFIYSATRLDIGQGCGGGEYKNQSFISSLSFLSCFLEPPPPLPHPPGGVSLLVVFYRDFSFDVNDSTTGNLLT